MDVIECRIIFSEKYTAQSWNIDIRQSYDKNAENNFWKSNMDKSDE